MQDFVGAKEAGAKEADICARHEAELTERGILPLK